MNMEIVQKCEAFKKVEGKMRFSYTQVFARRDGILYSGKWPNQHDSPNTLEELQEPKRIPTEDRDPEIEESWSAVFIKTPSLLAYIDGNIEKRIAREVETCEILRKKTHPNIATYYGCNECHGRVSGLCFKRYTSTLLAAVNPQYLNKAAFLSSGRQLVTENVTSGLQGLLAAIKHLHSLGIVHNDINPANIMLDEESKLILIDFDSCRYLGESLRSTETKRTWHWHDPSVDISTEKNDLDAFKDLQTWLTGSTVEDFIFL
ncbi:kinase-like protein [Aspergillus floccosus]